MKRRLQIAARIIVFTYYSLTAVLSDQKIRVKIRRRGKRIHLVIGYYNHLLEEEVIALSEEGREECEK